MERRTFLSLMTAPIVLAPLRAAAAVEPASTYESTRKLLAEAARHRVERRFMRKLFEVGDARIAELVKALGDPDFGVSVEAQRWIRYLGNPEGMRGLAEYYRRSIGHEWAVAGPIPTPLSDWDYQRIAYELECETAFWHDVPDWYMYALALEDSERTRPLLALAFEKAAGAGEESFVGRAVRQLASGRNLGDLGTSGRLDVASLQRAFFVDEADRKYAEARLIAYSGAKDKALVEIYIGRGILAEEWWHAVVARSADRRWRYESITCVALS
jgi:hypothetical protein